MVRPRQVSDEEILRAARHCFRVHGPAVSTSVIADELGVSAQALLKRFGSKHELMMAALLPPPIPPLVTWLEAGPTDQPLAVQLRELAEHAYQQFAELIPNLLILSASGTSNADLLKEYEVPPPLIIIRAFSDWLRRAHAMGLTRKTHWECTAVAILGSMQAESVLSQVLEESATQASKDTFIAEVAAAWTRALAPESAAPQSG